MIRKSKKAIASLNKHLSDIDSVRNVQEGDTWKAALKDTINLYIGEKSSISQRLDKLFFTRKETYVPQGVIGIFDKHVYDESKKQNFKDLILSAIRYIELNGIYRNPNNKNFLNHFGNAEIISGTVFVTLLVFGIGNYFGKLEKDREIMQIETKNKDAESLNESLKSENLKLRVTIDSIQLNKQ
ncbi:MAG: hypothetical protein ACK5XN_22025 [Bacteroidota bacterium]|jgi:hypothetical protein